jgi:oxalate decarboxylase/phosphoglucose isomerase-like protein (cupin superfamily)
MKSRSVVMHGFIDDLTSIAQKSEAFRTVVYTAKNCQLVLMTVLDGVRTPIRAGFAVLVPAGANHNIINTGSIPLKLVTLYAPPNHRDGVVHQTREEAEADDEQFDGATTE